MLLLSSTLAAAGTCFKLLYDPTGATAVVFFLAAAVTSFMLLQFRAYTAADISFELLQISTCATAELTLLDVVVSQGPAVLQLLAGENQTLLVRRDACENDQLLSRTYAAGCRVCQLALSLQDNVTAGSQRIPAERSQVPCMKTKTLHQAQAGSRSYAAEASTYPPCPGFWTSHSR